MMMDMIVEPEEQTIDSDRRERSILIVEDDLSIAEILALRLEQQGYRTYQAHTGSSGLAQAHDHRPHLVLMDLRLPDADGLDLCQQLDESPSTCGIPVIVLSGMERPDIIRRAREVGCQYYVRKPYDPNALLLLIQHALREADDYDL
jgi:DNA-binding response OmpR family regulator